MRNLFNWLIIYIVISSSVACNNADKKSAAMLSNTIKSVNDTAFYLGKSWGEKFGQAVATKDFISVSTYRLKVVHYLDSTLLVIANMKDVGGSEDLRTREIDFLKFEKQIFTNVATIERFDQTTSDEKLLKTLDDLKVVSKMETGMLANIQQLQMAYAEKNGIADSLKK